MTIVSNNIKYLRRLNGLTQEQFSKRIGIKRSLLGAYEEARANPNLDNLQNMAKIFNTSVDNLIKTDIRKIKETPGLNYQTNQNISRPEIPVQPIANVIDKYFTDVPVHDVRNVTSEIEKSQIADYQSNREKTNVNFSYQDGKAQFTNIENKNYISENAVVNGIPFVNKNEIVNYINKRNLNPYLSSLPQISLPNINIQNCRAFMANDEFPNENSIIIGELIERNTAINEGQHYLLICHDGRLLFRRVFDLTRIKGCYLLSSDNHEISSTEIPDNQIVEILKFVAHIGYSVPKISSQNPKIKNLIEELYRELGRS
jgi:transcriptional regulator with XRE-family HTH domain